MTWLRLWDYILSSMHLTEIDQKPFLDGQYVGREVFWINNRLTLNAGPMIFLTIETFVYTALITRFVLLLMPSFNSVPFHRSCH